MTVARTAELGTFSEPRGEDLPDDPSTIGYVQVDGETATGKIANRKNPYDHDYFRVDLTGGHSYRIDVKGDEELDYGGTLQNPYVLLWRVNEEGAVENLLAGNPYVTVAGGYSFVGIDDHNSGEGKNARLKIDVLIGGSYLLDIRGIGSNIRPIDYGTYSVTLARTDDD